MQAVRLRSESTADKYAKKQIEEGYRLWDRDYPLGALRLFIFKAESALPFQQGELLDAASELSVQLDGREDAKETYAVAAEKYKIVQQTLLSDMMKIKILEIDEGTAAARTAMEELLKDAKPSDIEEIKALRDKKQRTAYARAYLYLAELYLTRLPGSPTTNNNNDDDDDQPPAEDLQKAMQAARHSIAIGEADSGWERLHAAYYLLGDAQEQSGDLTAARDSYRQAVTLCPHYVQALERLMGVNEALQPDRTPAVLEEHLLLLEALLQAHPSADRLREKAFLLSELRGDEAALAFIAVQLGEDTNDTSHHKNKEEGAVPPPPPQEEMETVEDASIEARCVLLKAKAAVLADSGQWSAALEAAEAAAATDPTDTEAAKLVEDIQRTMKS